MCTIEGSNMNYYNEIKNKIIDNEVYSKVKDYSKERHKVITYFEIGKLLNEAGGKYGDNIIDEYSKKLIVEVGKKYNRRTLFRMKQFYNIFYNPKVSTMWTQLTWSHLRLLFNLEVDSMNYYIQTIINKHLSVRELEFKIKANEYERLRIETKDKLIIEDKIEVKDLVPNPILIRNKNNMEIVTEKALHYLILEDIVSFMKELGNSFSFIGSEYKIKIGDRNHYIDLLLFNIKYNCYVVVELKVTEFKVEYISQVQKYMNYIDINIKEVSNNDTIGILICKRENKFVIEYCSDERIAVREYELVLYNVNRR
jgi:predicted nuclease of restriction endonuclease-like (RecB) superfamily